MPLLKSVPPLNSRAPGDHRRVIVAAAGFAGAASAADASTAPRSSDVDAGRLRRREARRLQLQATMVMVLVAVGCAARLSSGGLTQPAQLLETASVAIAAAGTLAAVRGSDMGGPPSSVLVRTTDCALLAQRRPPGSHTPLGPADARRAALRAVIWGAGQRGRSWQ